jgi:hypothetical protein
VPRRHERAAATRNRRGTIPRLTEINSSLPPQPANVQPTPRHQTPQKAAATKLQIIHSQIRSIMEQ